MSPSTKPRIKKNPPDRQFTESTYRKAKPYLLVDFEGRCAYSLQHVNRVGVKTMDVDHFNPLLKGLARHKYSNLFPATRHTNGSKTNLWPSRALRKAGVRFLDPTKETDYGVHIFEDPKTHLLVGVTPAGKYHIRCCDLNAPHLVIERSDRTKLSKLLVSSAFTLENDIYWDGKKFKGLSSDLRAILDRMIPYIPPPPDGQPAQTN
ncbi:MAG: hypothetical protein HZA89_08245 [Verrucomicrobia bacterium]|nr:hypothetical protein [Verrucomicrobiota bacterium]